MSRLKSFLMERVERAEDKWRTADGRSGFYARIVCGLRRAQVAVYDYLLERIL